MTQPKKKEVGEGDRESARRYNRDTREFVENQYDKAKSRKPDSDSVEDGKLTEEESKARARAKEFDPRVTRDYDEAADRD